MCYRKKIKPDLKAVIMCKALKGTKIKKMFFKGKNETKNLHHIHDSCVTCIMAF